MTPDAGSSDKVSKNRGFMAIPEVGDQVVANFAHQHPDRPFVMGGIYHGKVGGGGGAGNNVRSFSSKSGNIIALNDGAGIEIKDKAGNHVTLSGTGNLTTEISAEYTENVVGVEEPISLFHYDNNDKKIVENYDITQSQYENSVYCHLKYVMSKEEFKKRFENK